MNTVCNPITHIRKKIYIAILLNVDILNTLCTHTYMHTNNILLLYQKLFYVLHILYFILCPAEALFTA